MAMTGGCLCGKVRYKISGEPQMSVICHCKNCQRQAGSSFSAIIGVPREALEYEGEIKTYADKGDSGGSVDRQFCPDCGSPLFSLVGSLPQMVFVKAGTLDDTSNLQPAMHIFTKSKQAWVELGDLPAFDTAPG
ncbi:GFA family protein [Altererythrobacter arenosus]|uniref:GFA family protein n=1 Tax=Altererythrobacter arenosus TaxID=3032592 RepID=A0ABY8FT42_9SPHN|nr:GFA family protein [Altererythrobacter sp. CAU 1644]WFL76251.1 GFA family protein [Altererythrobacter sp. CAU 1644]